MKIYPGAAEIKKDKLYGLHEKGLAEFDTYDDFPGKEKFIDYMKITSAFKALIAARARNPVLDGINDDEMDKLSILKSAIDEYVQKWKIQKKS